MIAQLAQRIKRRRGRGQILVARAGRRRRRRPRHTRSALLRLPGAGCLRRLGRLRKSRCRTQRAKRVDHDRQTGDEGKRPHGSVHVGLERPWACPLRRNSMHPPPPMSMFLRPEDWSKGLSIATFVKSLLSRTLVRRTMFDAAGPPRASAMPPMRPVRGLHERACHTALEHMNAVRQPAGFTGATVGLLRVMH